MDEGDDVDVDVSVDDAATIMKTNGGCFDFAAT